MMSEAKEPASITSRPITYTHKIPVAKTKIFWEKLREGKICTTKCKKCGSLYFPPQVDCPQCLTSEVEWLELGEEAVLETYTHVQTRPQGFTQYEPYIIAVAKTSEGVKVMGWLEDVKPTEIKVGMKLKMATKTLPDGYITIVFKP
ncbi:MAG: Zn-ribbon domain-containing OB-fold protein [Candidatus Norongarragalinales archaeon]